MALPSGTVLTGVISLAEVGNKKPARIAPARVNGIGITLGH